MILDGRIVLVVVLIVDPAVGLVRGIVLVAAIPVEKTFCSRFRCRNYDCSGKTD